MTDSVSIKAFLPMASLPVSTVFVRRRGFQSISADRSIEAAASGATVFTNSPLPSSKPVGMLVRGVISRCQW